MADAKILIVEDEGIEALDIQYRLKSLGYPEPDIAVSGEEALRKVEETTPDLVLMDIMLHDGIDGVTTAEKIHDRFDIPVVYLTAYADEDTLQRAKITEPFGYLTKPFRERELHVTIDVALYKHKMERKLKESEKWLFTTLKSIGDAVIATDRNGLITFMNPVAEDLIGWKLEDVLHGRLTEVFRIINRNTRQPAENPVTKALIEGKIVGLANHTVLIARDGKEIPIDDSAAPIKDDKGNIIGVILVFRDVTERETAHEALRESEERFRLFVREVQSYAIYMLDTQGCVVSWNTGAEQIKGYGADEIIGRHIASFYPPEDNAREIPLQLLRRAATEGRSEVEGWRVRKDGSRFWANVVINALKDENGKLRGFSKVTRDITERRRMEDELRRAHGELELRVRERTAELSATVERLELTNQELQEFAYIASHDLQEPLRKIQTFCDLICLKCRPDLDSTGQEYLDRVISSAGRMRQLLDDLLQFARAATRPEPFHGMDLTRIVREAADVFENKTLEAEGLVRIANMPEIEADETQMLRLFQNLIGNALKYNSDKDPRIRIHAKLDKQGFCEIRVEDNGIGFDQCFSERIFRPFQRLHNRGEYEGTGMGLAICRKIVERHGGSIRAESEPGKGSTFIIRLPVRQSKLKDT